MIAWASKKQPVVTLSSVEAEYVAACQAVWLRRVLDGLKQKQQESTTIYCDNTLVIALSKNNVFHQKRKNIDIKYHFIRELVRNEELHLNPCKFSDQMVVIFTKPLAVDLFQFHKRNLGVVSLAET